MLATMKDSCHIGFWSIYGCCGCWNPTVKALQEPEVSNSLYWSGLLFSNCPKLLLILLLHKPANGYSAQRFLCSLLFLPLFELSPWELCYWLSLLGGPSAALLIAHYPSRKLLLLLQDISTEPENKSIILSLFLSPPNLSSVTPINWQESMRNVVFMFLDSGDD